MSTEKHTVNISLKDDLLVTEGMIVNLNIDLKNSFAEFRIQDDILTILRNSETVLIISAKHVTTDIPELLTLLDDSKNSCINMMRLSVAK